MTSTTRQTNTADEAGDTKEIFLVANTYGSDISVYDTELRHLYTIDVGGHPDEITIPTTADVLYVPRRNRDDLVAIDLASGEQRWSVALSGSPHHTTISTDDRLVYTPIFNQTFLEVVDVDEGAVVEQIDVGYGGHGSLLNQDGTRLYVGTMIHDQLVEIDTATHQVTHKYLFPEAVRPFELSADEKQLYVQLSKLHGFVVVDVATGVVLDRVNLPLPPSGSPTLPREFPHTVNHGLALTPDGGFIMAAASLDRFVAVFDASTFQLVTTIPVGDEPNWIIFDSDGDRAFVSNRASDEISVISTHAWTEIERMKVGIYPQRMAVTQVAGNQVTVPNNVS